MEAAPYYYEYLTSALRRDRDVTETAVRRCGEVLKFAPRHLQADLELAMLAAHEPTRPMRPHMTSPAHLYDPDACARLFPHAVRWNDEWLVEQRRAGRTGSVPPRTAPGVETKVKGQDGQTGVRTREERQERAGCTAPEDGHVWCATHIPTRRCFAYQTRALLGIAPPPPLSVTTQTTLQGHPVTLSIDVDPNHGWDEWHILVEHTLTFDKLCRGFQILFDARGSIRYDGRRLTMARMAVSLLPLDEERVAQKQEETERDEQCERQHTFQIEIEDTRLTMEMLPVPSPTMQEGKDLGVFKQDFGVVPHRSVSMPLYLTLGNRVQAELLFRRRLQLACTTDEMEEEDTLHAL